MKKLLVAVLGMIVPNFATAAPVAVAQSGNVTVTLYDDECQMKEVVTNLPRRAVWKENGKDIEGCFGMVMEMGLITFYFADKTVAAAPVKMFTRISGT